MFCFGPLGPKPDPVVVTTAFAEINFVEKVSGHSRRARLSRFARRFAQKCELFLDFTISRQSEISYFLPSIQTLIS